MRIVYVGTVPPLPGGISHSGAQLTAALRKAGHDVEIISWAAQYPRLLYKGSARDKGAVAPEGAQFVMRWWAPWSWWLAGRHARRADLLVLPWVTPAQAPAYCVVLAASSRVPRLVVVHNPYPHEPRALDTMLTRVVLRQADVLLAHSAAAAASISSLAPDVSVETAALPPTLAITPQPLPPHPPFKALFFGLVRPYKGLDIAIDALEILRSRGVPIELTVAGEFWEPVDPWNARIAAAGLTDAVHLHPGYVPDAEVSALLAAHHIVFAPYRSATQSAVVPLAWAAGRPTVATPVGGLVEQIRDGENGVLATAATGAAFADAVTTAIDNLDSLASGSRDAALTAPTWDAVARVVESVARRLGPPIS
jgi:glycosyltransferase involved in cell wall biosynthesis